ncbi:MAG: chemotaxis protein CheA [Tepidanaerobacteraceae bacterium]|jgi:two-component system chemotaxis sensor kinase CheA|nr:chemotaxis protein CheA [Tepidanaerobacter sp.]HQA60080.1 chemotaxis protein CheA [Tepidanaerobacteraceae bacterium]
MNNQYLDVFLEEAKEHIENLNKYLLELENNPSQEIVDEIFRSAHTLKGMSGTMGFTQLLELTHEMENLLQEIRSQEISVNEHIIDTLLKSVDILEELIHDVEEHGQEQERDIHMVLQMLKGKKAIGLDEAKVTPNENEENYVFSFNEYEERIIRKALEQGLYIWRVKVTLVDECLLKSARAFLVFKNLEAFGDIIKTEPSVQDIEDEKFDNEFTLYLITSKNKNDISQALSSVSELKSVDVTSVEHNSIAVRKIESDKEQNSLETVKTLASRQKTSKGTNGVRRTSKTLRVDIERLDNLMNLVSELIIIKTRLEDIKDNNYQAQRETIEYLERITSNLHDAVMKARMVPIENVFNRFPRVVHDLSRELSKKINLIIEGAETELDRTVIDEIGDPLIHLIRNAADHGIEYPQERVKKGKPEHGTINLKAYQDGNNVIIEVSDDGRGIDLSSVLTRALDVGLTSAEQAKNLKDYEIISYLFEPGFSTSSEVTDVSGRGVGLDVVKTKIESLGGSIETSFIKDKGTTFQIRLPLTLAIIQALMVLVGNEKYAIPLSSIRETVIVTKDQIKTVQKREVILLRGNVIPIIRLNQALETEKFDENQKELTLVIVKKGEKNVGLAVDDLIGQQEIVIKSLGKFLNDIEFIAGATILGNGEVALILDINKLV